MTKEERQLKIEKLKKLVQTLIDNGEISENARYATLGSPKGGSRLRDCDCHEQPQP